MDYKREYFCEWMKDEKYEKALLLWLWYDYQTETYDLSLWGIMPSKFDETMVVFNNYEAKKLSSINAERVRREMNSIADKHEIDYETMILAKNDSFRGRMKMQARLELYLEYEKMGKFNFINS
ncbi:hypothetical protein NSS71_08555 [Niallia sp. FSL W8-0951]|uniref:hypothetical protein n=1 Tax=unclassified Niallia TaxID=2837522 RepID=UPI0030FBD952